MKVRSFTLSIFEQQNICIFILKVQLLHTVFHSWSSWAQALCKVLSIYPSMTLMVFVSKGELMLNCLLTVTPTFSATDSL